MFVPAGLTGLDIFFYFRSHFGFHYGSLLADSSLEHYNTEKWPGVYSGLHPISPPTHYRTRGKAWIVWTTLCQLSPSIRASRGLSAGSSSDSLLALENVIMAFSSVANKEGIYNKFNRVKYLTNCNINNTYHIWKKDELCFVLQLEVQHLTWRKKQMIKFDLRLRCSPLNSFHFLLLQIHFLFLQMVK